MSKIATMKNLPSAADLQSAAQMLTEEMRQMQALPEMIAQQVTAAMAQELARFRSTLDPILIAYDQVVQMQRESLAHMGQEISNQATAQIATRLTEILSSVPAPAPPKPKPPPAPRPAPAPPPKIKKSRASIAWAAAVVIVLAGGIVAIGPKDSRPKVPQSATQQQPPPTAQQRQDAADAALLREIRDKATPAEIVLLTRIASRPAR